MHSTSYWLIKRTPAGKTVALLHVERFAVQMRKSSSGFLAVTAHLPISSGEDSWRGFVAMILDAARAAAGHLFSDPFRGVFFKTLGLTLLALIAVWFGLTQLFEWLALPWLQAFMPQMPDWAGWAGTLAAILAGIGLAFALSVLIAPVTAIVAGFFLDDVAELIEKADFPSDVPGRPIPAIRSIILSLKFFGIVVLANLLAMILLLVPGVNVGAFFLVNGYLIGREFFEFAAMRFRPEDEAKEVRRRNAGTVFLAGLVIAGFMAVPLLNLLTPLFACAMMVHLHKAITRREMRPVG
jgi:CysZ protein